jgi:NAD(P)-dependent dehydrogenase (short-subunit alcohol dehydrogenase family)
MVLLGGRVAVVTGAAAGLGRACALALAGAGVTVVVNQQMHGTAAVSDGGPGGTVRAIRERGGRALSSVDAVTDLASIRRVVAETLGAFGRLDIWVNTLALDPKGALLDISDVECDRQVGGELHSVVLCTREALRSMRDTATAGRIIQVGALRAQSGVGAAAVVSPAACAALAGFVGAAAAEAKVHGVTCNAVLPLVRPRGAGEYFANDPPSDVAPPLPADVVVFLASDAAAGLTGESFHVGRDEIALHRSGLGPCVKSLRGHWTVDELGQRIGELRAPAA